MSGNIGNKFVLCIPHGGLNDSMCQIEACYQYCERYGRRLVVDLSKSGFMTGGFYDYFDFKENNHNVLELNDELFKVLNNLRCYPHQFSRRLHSVAFIWDSQAHLFRDISTGKVITFNFEKNYYESLLIHEQCGGGTLSFDLLKRLKFSDGLKKKINEKLISLQSGYIGIHIRNTDYKTDFKTAFSGVADRLRSRNVLVCSDDRSVIDYAKSFFKNSNVMTLNEFYNTDSAPLHVSSNYQSDFERNKATINAFVDLIGLALSDNLFIFPCSGGNISGFSRLAMLLNQNKSIVTELLR